MNIWLKTIFKGFEHKTRIFGQYVISKEPWTQLSTTMKFWQNVTHIYVLKAKKFQVSKYNSKCWLGNFWQRIGVIGGNLKFFFEGGDQIWNLLQFGNFYYQNECCFKIWVKKENLLILWRILFLRILSRRILFLVQRSIPKWP